MRLKILLISLLLFSIILFSAQGQQNEVRIVLLANTIDYGLASDFFEFLRNKDVDVLHATATDYSQYKDEKFIVILGGPDADEGVGEIVKEVLVNDEQHWLREKGNRKMYVKMNVWIQGQVVIVIAGSDRRQTQQAHMENRETVYRKIPVPTQPSTIPPPPDTTLPSISITSHSDGQSVSTCTITVSGTASDNVDIDKVEVSVNEDTYTASGTTSWSRSATLNEGSNTITAKATDTSGNTNTTSITVDCDTPPQPEPPTAVASATPTTITEGESVSFSGATSTDPDGIIVAYAWDFGNGNPETGVTVTHTYSTSGSFTVTLTVTDDDGLPDTDTVSIIVNPSSVVWEIGENEAPPDYTEKAFDELDQSEPFNSHHYIGTMPDNEFPKEINDGKLTQIYIHYELTDREAEKDLILFLDTLYATHNNVSYFDLGIKVEPSDGDWIEIGTYRFGSDKSVYPEERNITIDKSYVEPGENIILLENVDPEWSGHWMIWDSLKLEQDTP